MKLSGSHLFSGIVLAAALAAPCTFAQGVFEGSGEVSDPNCVGDGCGYVPADQVQEQNYQYGDNPDVADTDQTSSEQANSDQANSDQNAAEGSDENAAPDSSAQLPADSVKAVSAVAVDTTDIDDEDEDRPHYVNESASEYRARKEGFSKGMQFGVRLGGGISKILGTDADKWNMGFEGTGGLITRLLLGKTLAIATELDFTYRHFSYEAKTSYSRNKATIDETLFEIPVMGQLIFDEDGFYAGLGINIGLKMTGDSEFKRKNTTDNSTAEKDSGESIPNPLPTENVDIGGLIDLGYVVNRWLMVDLRFVQNFTNLLDLDLIAESSLMHSKLYTMHITLGATFLL